MDDMFAALRTDNQERLQQLTSPDFYAYDGGMRFTGPAMIDFIKQGHASGKRWVWSITDPEVHVTCNLAWITYVNQGSVEDASGRQALTWLESAIMEYSNARWHIRFIHSTRAPKPTSSWKPATEEQRCAAMSRSRPDTANPHEGAMFGSIRRQF
jgi:hypothetical protein